MSACSLFLPPSNTDVWWAQDARPKAQSYTTPGVHFFAISTFTLKVFQGAFNGYPGVRLPSRISNSRGEISTQPKKERALLVHTYYTVQYTLYTRLYTEKYIHWTLKIQLHNAHWTLLTANFILETTPPILHTINLYAAYLCFSAHCTGN